MADDAALIRPTFYTTNSTEQNRRADKQSAIRHGLQKKQPKRLSAGILRVDPT